MPGGIDTLTAESMLAYGCDIELPRWEDGDYISLLDLCGGHTSEYHYHERLDCLYDVDATGHSTMVGYGTDTASRDQCAVESRERAPSILNRDIACDGELLSSREYFRVDDFPKSIESYRRDMRAAGRNADLRQVRELGHSAGVRCVRRALRRDARLEWRRGVSPPHPARPAVSRAASPRASSSLRCARCLRFERERERDRTAVDERRASVVLRGGKRAQLHVRMLRAERRRRSRDVGGVQLVLRRVRRRGRGDGDAQGRLDGHVRPLVPLLRKRPQLRHQQGAHFSFPRRSLLCLLRKKAHPHLSQAPTERPTPAPTYAPSAPTYAPSAPTYAPSDAPTPEQLAHPTPTPRQDACVDSSSWFKKDEPSKGECTAATLAAFASPHTRLGSRPQGAPGSPRSPSRAAP